MDDIVSFLSFLSILIVSYYAAVIVFNVYRIYKIVSQPNYDEEEQDLREEIVTEVEVIDGQYYIWNKETGDFITQAPTFQGIIDNCMKYHQNKIFHVTKEDIEKYRLKEQLKVV